MPMKWLLSLAIVLLIAVAFAPRPDLASDSAALAQSGATPTPTTTPTLAPPLVFVPLEQLNPFPTLSAENTTRTPPRQSLRARAHFPKPNAQHVPPDTLISIVFDTRMERASVEARFHVVRADTGAPVDGYFEWNNKLLLFYPVPLLENNVVYRVVLEPGAQALNKSDVLQDPVEWKFSTGELLIPES